MDKRAAAALSKDNLGPDLLVVAWVFASISLIVVIMRTYVRVHILRRFNIDDWLIYLTFILALCDSVLCTLAVRSGLGQHIHVLNPDQISNSVKYIYICEFFSIMSPCFGRISYAILLLQLIPTAKTQRRFLWTVIGIQFVVDVSTVIISFTQCRPVSAYWGPNAKQYCWDPVVQQYTGFFQGSVCSLVDMILAVFPARLFWNLQMKLQTKISLSVLMGLGVFAMVFSIVKTIKLQAISEKGDPTYALADLAIWWTLEAYMVLLAASIPTLKPVVRKRGNQSRRSKDRSSSFTLRKAAHGVSLSRRTEDGQWAILSEDIPSWNGNDSHNKTTDVKLGNINTSGNAEGINKTTTVTVSRQEDH
ncbi:hypothetical protein P171DRAFT_504428 [Karstenula rhodostoma CBS 690.94]|uniref:Rhodopsin domain-containing protein n=1 Tax=Karstenula rhodostoma CBS 690.94 TaxID=1392251 RepID=A0A9P4U5Q6_9PLEO|nr:hypothetical protein P171DRAFT_504428 [Karstenula rhodostoma CBS 690.94]